MSESFFIFATSLPTGALSTVGLGFLVVSRRYRANLALTTFLASSACTWALVFWPGLWTYEAAFLYECVQAVLGVLVALESARRWFVDRPVGLRSAHGDALFLALCTLLLALLFRGAGPWGEHWDYRGLVAVDICAAVVLAAVRGGALGGLLEHDITLGLMWSFAIHGVSLALWEIDPACAMLVDRLAFAAFLLTLWGVLRLCVSGWKLPH